MMKVGIVGVFALAVLAWIAPPALAAEGSAERATFLYEMGARIDGSADGSCEGRAVLPPDGLDGSLQLAPAAFALLRTVEVWYNYTLLLSETGDPVHYPADHREIRDQIALDGRSLMVAWGPSGRAAVHAYGTPARATDPFDASFSAHSLRLGPATSVHDGRSHPAEAPDHALVERPSTSIGLARELRAAEADLRVAGDFTLYLEAARITDGPRSYELPPYHEVTTSGTPGARSVSEHFRYAWLDVRESAFRTSAPGTVLYCADLDAQVVGVFTAFSAAGRVQAAPGELAFERKELSLAGQFRLREVIQPTDPDEQSAPTQATVDGRFDAVGLDFAIVEKPAANAWPVVASATLGGLALTIIGVVILYSRIAEDRILDRPERRRLYEAVAANPGIEFARLLEQNPMSATNARYHLKLLERRGLVRVVNVQGRHRFVPANLDVHRARQALLLSEDPKLRDLLELLDGDGRPASELVEALRREWGLSRTGGWKVLDRAVRAQLVERLVHQRRVILRRTH